MSGGTAEEQHVRYKGPGSFCGPVSEVVGGKRTKQPLVLASPDPLQPWGLSQGSSTGTVPAPYLLDFTEGFCGLLYLFQSSSWKVCIQTNCLWKGDLQREGGLWHCFTWPVKQSEGFRRWGFFGGRRAGLAFPGRPSYGSIIVLLLSLGQMGWN